jgi:hypothetical protein
MSGRNSRESTKSKMKWLGLYLGTTLLMSPLVVLRPGDLQCRRGARNL